jgi:hypothetical protein
MHTPQMYKWGEDMTLVSRLTLTMDGAHSTDNPWNHVVLTIQNEDYLQLCMFRVG